VERVDQAPVGSTANEFVLWEAACIRELFQSVEYPQVGRESEASSSVRSRALEDPKRDYSRSNDENVQGVRKAFRYNTDR